jgi:hypothetical protein
MGGGMPTAEYIRTGDACLYVCPFRVEYLRSLPWRAELFDAFVISLEDEDASERTRDAIAELVRLNNDWVETFGIAAERLHDDIDEASVAVGRQRAVGDGSPMTAWHDDLTSLERIVDYIRRGGHGSCDYKLVGIASTSVTPFIVELKKRLGARISEVIRPCDC